MNLPAEIGNRYSRIHNMTGRTKSVESDGTTQMVSQDEIIAMLALKAHDLAGLRTTAGKIPTLRKILSTAAADLPVDTRLPGIRDLALCLGTSLVTTQRAVTELVSEGILYSKPRAGVFVQDQRKSSQNHVPAFAPSPTQAARHPFRTGFDFGTDSTASYQKAFWEKLAELFCKQHPNTSPALHFEADISQHRSTLDVYERYEWNRHQTDDLNDIIDIKDFAGSLLPISTTAHGLLPLYYRTYFLFFNRSLLERHGLPQPDYRTFEEQSEYLRKLVPEFRRLGYDPKPYSIQEPVTLFGDQISQFNQLFDGSKSDSRSRSELIAATEKVTSFCELCRYSLKDRNEWMQAHDEFLVGRAPFFMGYSVDYWEFSQKNLPFSLGAYPTLCSDDTFFLWTRAGAVASQSEHPVESINFLTFLLRPEIQKHFASTGNFGANQAENLHPEMAADPSWVTSVFQKSRPFSLATKEQYYMAVNVLGGEIWRSLLEKVPAAEILDRAIQLGSSYLQYRTGKKSGSRRP
jgi:ABC-type glycerol-3-phosphate transport system substrate-binding protein